MVKISSTTKFGQSSASPLCFTSTPRAMSPKWRNGFSQVMGCSQCGMASTGVSDPDNDANGAGQRAALGAYERWSHEGRVVRIKLPPNAGDDFNDVIRSRHERRRQGRV